MIFLYGTLEVSLGASCLIGLMNLDGLNIVWKKMQHSVLFAICSSINLIVLVEMLL